MIERLAVVGCLSITAALMPAPATAQHADPPQSGYAYRSDELRALQDDAFANPGYLWVDKGRTLFQQPAGASQLACRDCHGADGATLDRAATHYPRYDAARAELENLEMRINRCRIDRQRAAPLPYESDQLLSLTAFVANLARGRPIEVDISGPAREHYEAGRQYFQTRRGQLNLACTHCHDQYAGKMLRGDRISEGHGNGFPAYRLQWQTLGSLHRRLRACDAGVRADPLPFGSPTYVDLELYLAHRAGGLLVETPAVRP